MLSKNLAFFCNLGYNEDYKKRVIPRVFPSGNFVCFDLFSMERSFASTAGKSMNNIGGNNDSILNFRDQRIQEALDFGFLVHGLWSHVWDFDSLCHGESFGPRCSTKKHEQYFVLRWAHAGLCLSLPLLWDAVCPLWRLCIGWFCQKPSSGYFQKGSNLLIWEYWSVLIRWVSHSDDDGRNQCAKCLSNGDPDLCTGTAQFDLCHCGLFLDQSGNGHDLCLCDHLFGSCLKHHHEDCVSALYRSIWSLWQSQQQHSRKHHQYAGGEVLR